MHTGHGIEPTVNGKSSFTLIRIACILCGLQTNWLYVHFILLLCLGISHFILETLWYNLSRPDSTGNE